MPTLAVDAILFDMDGTLVDESGSYREAIRMTAEYLLSQPVFPQEVAEVKRIPGLNNDWDAAWALVERRRHGTIAIPSEVDRRSASYRRLQDAFQTYYLGDRRWREMSQREPPFRWSEPLIGRETSLIAPETLHWLRAFRIGIATSRPRAEALMALHQHRLENAFSQDMLIAAEDVPFEKPHPEPLLELARRLGCRRPVYVGDTINDAMAAMAAGMPFIFTGSESLGDPDIEERIEYRIGNVNQIVSVCTASSRGQGSG